MTSLKFTILSKMNKQLVLLRFFPEYDESLHDGREGGVLLCGQLRPLAMRKQHRGCVSLEPGDGLGLTSLQDK